MSNFAFPGVIGPPSEYTNGMDLRDFFASKAMPDLLRYEGDRLPFCEVAELAYQMADAMLSARAIPVPTEAPPVESQVARQFQLGERVRKIKGASWQGRVVGFYSTELTPIGYAVESEREPGSVQIYPEAALAAEGSAE